MSRKSPIVRYSLSEARERAARDEFQTRADAPEAESLGEDFWNDAQVVLPHGKISVHLRLDKDVAEWFKKGGKGHLTRMNAVLRAYVEAQRRRSREG